MPASSVIIPNTLTQLTVGSFGATQLCTPRSMAIAYETIKIDGASVHLTEIGTSGVANTPVFLTDGWSQDITNINIWVFCKVDQWGQPLDANGAPVVPLPLGMIPRAVNLGSRIMPPGIVGGGFCKCITIDTTAVGCNANSDNLPNASRALYLAVSFEPTPTTQLAGQTGVYASYNPVARSISVTIHAITGELQGASFTPTP